MPVHHDGNRLGGIPKVIIATILTVPIWRLDWYPVGSVALPQILIQFGLVLDVGFVVEL